MTKILHSDVIRAVCEIQALVAHAKAEYTLPNDGFCDECMKARPGTFQSCGTEIDYIREAVVAKLAADGHAIPDGFNEDGRMKAMIEPTPTES